MPNSPATATIEFVGVWRSLVARVVRDDEAVSSSLTTPTTRNHQEAAGHPAASSLLALLAGTGRMPMRSFSTELALRRRESTCLCDSYREYGFASA